MKKAIIGAFVGAILVFGWQSVAHMFMHHHDAGLKQVASQDSVINQLSVIFKEEGQYLVPRANPDASQEDAAKYQESRKGKPFAVVTYQPVLNNDMGMAVVRSFTTALLSVFLFILILGKRPGSFAKIVGKSIALGLVMFIFIYYNAVIWMQTPWDAVKGELIDLLVEWTLCGIWLGYWLKRDKSKGNGKGYGNGFAV